MLHSYVSIPRIISLLMHILSARYLALIQANPLLLLN